MAYSDLSKTALIEELKAKDLQLTKQTNLLTQTFLSIDLMLPLIGSLVDIISKGTWYLITHWGEFKKYLNEVKDIIQQIKDLWK